MKSQFHFAVSSAFVCFVLFTLNRGAFADTATESGPENAALTMKLSVVPNATNGKEGYDAGVEIRNVAGREITLLTDWRRDDETGELKDFVEAAISIESYPAIEPWIGGVRQTHRTAPQSEQVLKAGEVLSVRWHTDGRRLKNKVLHPQEIQNPTFPVPGMYAVHATVALPTGGGPVFLRSNEVLVPVGGSRELPRHTYGRFLGGDAEHKTGTIDLGSRHKVKAGDQFLIGYMKTGQWRMTITQVDPESSVGHLEPEPTRRDGSSVTRPSQSALAPRPL
jgi:hypothetical protein